MKQPIIHTAGTNHFLNGEAVGGKLFLYADRLVFKSHRLNIQNHELEIALADVADIEFYNLLLVVPNGFKIIMVNDREEKFVVMNHEVWKRKINELRAPQVVAG